jgi:hypothetical protein
LLVRGECRVLAGDLEAGARDLADVARSRGTHSGQPDRLRALEWLAITHFLLGSWQEADSLVDAVEAFGDDTAGQALRAMFATLRGAARRPEARAGRRRTAARRNRRIPTGSS